MKIKPKHGLLGLLLGVAGLMAIEVYKFYEHDAPPEGFVIESNGHGYRYNDTNSFMGSEWIIFSPHWTRRGAIRDAWSMHNHIVKSGKEPKWVAVEDIPKPALAPDYRKADEMMFRCGATWALLHRPPESCTNVGQMLDWFWKRQIEAEGK